MTTLRSLLWAGVVLALGTFAYATFFDTNTYDVKGRVAGVKDDTTLFVEHERIPGYMPPMIMPLPVRDARLMDGLQTGDAIQFRLRVSDERAEIEDRGAVNGVARAARDGRDLFGQVCLADTRLAQNHMHLARAVVPAALAGGAEQRKLALASHEGEFRRLVTRRDTRQAP